MQEKRQLIVFPALYIHFPAELANTVLILREIMEDSEQRENETLLPLKTLIKTDHLIRERHAKRGSYVYEKQRY